MCFVFVGVLLCVRTLRGRRGFTQQPENSKRAHLRPRRFKTPPKFHEKTPRETQKERNGGKKGKKKREILGPPPSGPHPFGAPPFRTPPHFSGQSRFGQSRSQPRCCPKLTNKGISASPCSPPSPCWSVWVSPASSSEVRGRLRMEYPRVCLAKSQFGCRFDQSWFRPRDHVVQHVKGFFCVVNTVHTLTSELQWLAIAFEASRRSVFGSEREKI